MVLRQRKGNIEKITDQIQDLDVFVKVDEQCVNKTIAGALIHILTVFCVIFLIWTDFAYYFNPGHKFKFGPDKSLSGRLEMEVDMTVAMPCDNIGADVLDSTNQNTLSHGRLKEDPTWFDLDRLQRKHFESIKVFNEYLREEYHSLQDVLWNSGYNAVLGDIPERKVVPDEPHDACRIHGTLALNKVEGNFHITIGKSIPMFGGHAHLSGIMEPSEYNFTHRIDKFGYGAHHGGIIQPLQGDEKIADKNFMNYQYFVKIVPTEIHTLYGTWQTYQYSVKEHAKEVGGFGGLGGSNSMPGIYFKYDISALKLIVTQDREPLWQFLVRLCAGIGGIISCSHLVAGIVHFLLGKISGKDVQEEQTAAN